MECSDRQFIQPNRFIFRGLPSPSSPVPIAELVDDVQSDKCVKVDRCSSVIQLNDLGPLFMFVSPLSVRESARRSTIANRFILDNMDLFAIVDPRDFEAAQRANKHEQGGLSQESVDRSGHIHHYDHHCDAHDKSKKGRSEGNSLAKNIVRVIRLVVHAVSSFLFADKSSKTKEVEERNVKEGDKEPSSTRDRITLVERITFFVIGFLSGIVSSTCFLAASESVIVHAGKITAVLIVVNQSKAILNELQRVMNIGLAIRDFLKEFWMELHHTGS